MVRTTLVYMIDYGGCYFGISGSTDTDKNRVLCLELTIHLKGCLSAIRMFRYVVSNGTQCFKSHCVSKLIRQLTEAGKNFMSQTAKLINVSYPMEFRVFSFIG